MAEHPKAARSATGMTDHELLEGIYSAVTAIRNIMVLFVVLALVAVAAAVVAAGSSTGT